MKAKPDAGKAEARAATGLDPVTQHLCQRVKALRQTRDWSLDALARASGVSRSMLSQIERAQTNPTLAVACRIARAFGMSLGEMVETPGVSSSVEVVRVGDRAHHYSSDSECTIRTLSPLHLEKDVEFYEVALAPGGALRSAPHFAGTREFITVQKGRVKIESDKDRETLDRGDSATYRADVPHAIVNAGKSGATVFLVVIYR